MKSLVQIQYGPPATIEASAPRRGLSYCLGPPRAVWLPAERLLIQEQDDASERVRSGETGDLLEAHRTAAELLARTEWEVATMLGEATSTPVSGPLLLRGRAAAARRRPRDGPLFASLSHGSMAYSEPLCAIPTWDRPLMLVCT